MPEGPEMKTYDLAELHSTRLKSAITFTCDRCGRVKTSRNVVLVGPLRAEGSAPALCNGCYGTLVAKMKGG